MENLVISTAGDAAIFCKLGNHIDPLVSDRVLALNKLIKNAEPEGLIETVPSYTGIMVYFDPNITSSENLSKTIRSFEKDAKADPQSKTTSIIDIPVCYTQQYGPDLEYVGSYCGLSSEELIQIHTSVEYRIYMLGFTPGFPYLGGMDKRIATPRLETPRVKIRAGSIGIAGEQTGIYPIDSPGGWRLIGKTPVKLIDFNENEPFLFKAGDYLKFRAISLQEYFEIAELQREGNYKIEKSVRV